MKQPAFLLIVFLSTFLITKNLEAQTRVYDECLSVDIDYRGLISAGNPDILDLASAVAPDDLVLELGGCFAPSDADYNDLFRFFVPAGYILESMRFRVIDPFFSDITELNMDFWYGDECTPLLSPDLEAGGYSAIDYGDPWSSNAIAPIAPLSTGWYSIRLKMNATPSSTRYFLVFTFACDDSTPPTFTTPVGALDASFDCNNAAGIGNALLAEPVGTDNSGSVTLDLVNDQTIPGACANAYTRIRTWSLEDGCGNSSVQQYTQTIEVVDESRPLFTTVAGTLDVVLDCDDAGGLAAALASEPTGLDVCGSVSLQLINDITEQDPTCPQAYNRVRSWRLVDPCGNTSLAVFHQSIEVQDNTPPVVVPNNGAIAIADPEGYVLTPADVLNLGATYDLCSDISILITPPVLGCELLDTTVPVDVEVTDECGNVTNVIALIDVTEDTGIHPPWDHDDINNTANGSAMHSPCEGTFSITSNDLSMLYTDGGHFVYVDLCGDGEITARVAEVNPLGGWGGLMIRESMQPGSKKVAVKATLNGNVYREVRSATNGLSQMTFWPYAPGPVWLRINRTGNIFSIYLSSNGIQWVLRSASMLNVGDCVLMGLYAESNNNVPITAIFDEVSIGGGIQPLQVAPTSGLGIVENIAADQAPAMPSVFPNPGADHFQLDLSPYAGQMVTIDVVDLHGKKLISQTIEAGMAPQPLNLTTQQNAGLYLIRIQPENGQPVALKLLVN